MRSITNIKTETQKDREILEERIHNEIQKEIQKKERVWRKERKEIQKKEHEWSKDLQRMIECLKSQTSNYGKAYERDCWMWTCCFNN